ncbi:hypothetical protein GGR57DRAFT_511420 [Xylariaceae sp. FL1272]|nr:hypothetical protein GGR57DRAFT_511420 [Xylariaceae sp. FL1272]
MKAIVILLTLAVTCLTTAVPPPHTQLISSVSNTTTPSVHINEVLPEVFHHAHLRQCVDCLYYTYTECVHLPVELSSCIRNHCRGERCPDEYIIWLDYRVADMRAFVPVTPTPVPTLPPPPQNSTESKECATRSRTLGG